MPELRSYVAQIVKVTAKNPVGWLFYRFTGRLATYLRKIHAFAQLSRRPDSAQSSALAWRPDDRRKIAHLTTQLFPELTVADGPFRGLRYPSTQSVGSMFLPKLLGSYESELHPVFTSLLENRYSAAVDIGCAEGYYAVGLAMRVPSAEVFAFDTNPRARRLCAEMASLNSVASKVHVGELCDQAVLRKLPLGERALIICDCEGYEGLLFDAPMAEFLVRHDLIIETHDFIDIGLSKKMIACFGSSHRIQAIKGVDDIEKANTFVSPRLETLSARDRWLALREQRPAIMEWLVMTRK
jgi:hypothetical protein